MALTRESLTANEVLGNLTEDQLTAIVNLSKNDENSVIASKVGEIYGGLDADVLAVSGMEKNASEKTYDYAKRVIGQFKEQADSVQGLQSQVDALNREKDRLQSALAKGANDSEVAKQMKQLKADNDNLHSQYNELNTKYLALQANHDKELFDVRINNELDAATAGLNFKPGISKEVIALTLKQAKDNVKGMNPEYIDDGKGGKQLVFKDANGATKVNPANQMFPYTPKELVLKELETFGILEAQRQGAGAGSASQQPKGTGTMTMDLSAARTKVEATEIISKALLAQGLTRGSKAYDDAMAQAWKDNNVSSLSY